jgi:hypothetical protein
MTNSPVVVVIEVVVVVFVVVVEVLVVLVVEVLVVVVAVLVPEDRLMSKHCLCNYLLSKLHLLSED